MRLQTPDTQVDFYPVGSQPKRFVKCVTWHLGANNEFKSFSTVVKTDALYSINNLIANGATVTDFNIEEYTGKDYSPMFV